MTATATEKVIKGLESLYDAMHKNQCYTCSHEFIEVVNEFGTNILIDAIELLKDQQHWINIKDRMPDEQGYYLVSGGGKVWLCEMFCLGSIIRGWSNSALNPSVEAWMLLPKPYKKGE